MSWVRFPSPAPADLRSPAVRTGRHSGATGARTYVTSMRRILCIEDDETTAREIISELTACGFEVDWAADGRDGLVKAVSESYEAITLDRMLPNVDGLAIVSVV